MADEPRVTGSASEHGEPVRRKPKEEGESLVQQLSRARARAHALDQQLQWANARADNERHQLRKAIDEARSDRDELSDLVQRMEAFLAERGIWQEFLEWDARQVAAAEIGNDGGEQGQGQESAF